MIPKFRAWDKVNERIVEVSEINFWTKVIDTTDTFLAFSNVELLQSTGLFDKNGTEIYEGDVVKVQAEEPEPKIRADRHVTGVIIYDYGSFDIETKPNTVSGLIPESNLTDIRLTLEVIGNQFEHPHLLEE